MHPREGLAGPVGALHTAVPVLRQRVAFHQANLLDMSRAIPRMHLIVCRNVIIYFKREAQGKVIQRFHDALLPGGFLVLGKAESLLGRLRGSFAPVSSRERVYRRS